MSTEDRKSVVSALAGGLRGSEPPAPSEVVRATQEGPKVDRYANAPGGAVDHALPAQPHPGAAVPPGAPRFTQAVEVDAPTVDLIIKRHALELLKAQGFACSDGEFYARARVLRVEGGGCVVEVRR